MNIHVQKSVPIEFTQVVKAYQKVRKGGKGSGIDRETWEAFDKEVQKHLYVIWNRLASGSYHPQAVREVEIPKKDGRVRTLGIPTLRDRIAQQVVKDYMEKRIDGLFHENSYGYRPIKSAHQAIQQVRANCYQTDWVIDLDISKFFDEVAHELVLKAVEHVMEEKWVKMYVKRWLEAPVQKHDGTLQQRAGKGTPQGGVISPLLANLYLHFTLDMWLSKHYPKVRFVRYADDIVVHCVSKAEAEGILAAIKVRLAEVKLQIREEKTRIAYCKDYRRRGKHDHVKFEFLGFSYQPRARKSIEGGGSYTAFTAEVSSANQKRIRDEIRAAIIWRYTQVEVSEIAKRLNPKLRGWLAYYGLFSTRCLRRSVQSIDRRLIKWLRKKHKLGFRKAVSKLNAIRQAQPALFHHWQAGY